MEYTLKVYKNSALEEEYSRVRFRNGSTSSFELQGHRWKYRFTSFDDSGDYDLLYRFTDEPEPEPEPDLTELRDMFAGLAMQGMISSSVMMDNVTDSAVEWAAKGAYKMADAMLAARNK